MGRFQSYVSQCETAVCMFYREQSPDVHTFVQICQRFGGLPFLLRWLVSQQEHENKYSPFWSPCCLTTMVGGSDRPWCQRNSDTLISMVTSRWQQTEWFQQSGVFTVFPCYELSHLFYRDTPCIFVISACHIPNAAVESLFFFKHTFQKVQ